MLVEISKENVKPTMNLKSKRFENKIVYNIYKHVKFKMNF